MKYIIFTESIFRIRLRSASFNVLIVDESMGDELSSLSASCKTGPGHRIENLSMMLSGFRQVTGSKDNSAAPLVSSSGSY